MTMIAEDLCAEQMLKPVMTTLQDRIGPQKFNAWFKHGTEVAFGDDHIKVLVPNPFVANWIEHHYQSDLVESFFQHTRRRLP
ncbi:MAG TPA: DnaA N-terminal domain-containing protein, partial [Phycisphaerae bacterium]|nr:DnaA N-terminal domain-containing protein [Phycisphaerae bacterium]